MIAPYVLPELEHEITKARTHFAAPQDYLLEYDGHKFRIHYNEAFSGYDMACGCKSGTFNVYSFNNLAFGLDIIRHVVYRERRLQDDKEEIERNEANKKSKKT